MNRRLVLLYALIKRFGHLADSVRTFNIRTMQLIKFLASAYILRMRGERKNDIAARQISGDLQQS